VRLAGCLDASRDYCRGCEAFPTMYRTWKPQSGVGLELEDMVKQSERSQAPLTQTSQTRLAGLNQNGMQSGPGALTSPGAHPQTAGVESGPKPSGVECRTWKGCWPGPRRRGRPNRKAGQQEQHGDDRRSQSRPVMGRICPRRSGLEWRERLVEPLQLGIAIDERLPSLGAPRALAQRSRGSEGRIPVLPSCLAGLRCVL